MYLWILGFITGAVGVGGLAEAPPHGWLLLPLALIPIIHRHPIARFAAGLALALALGMVHGNRVMAQRLLPSCELDVLRLTGTVTSLPRVRQLFRGRQQRFEFRVTTLEPARCQGPRRVLLAYYGEQPILPGDQWQFAVRLKRPWGLANPGSFNMQSWYALSAIDAVGSVRAGAERRLSAATGLASLADRLRYRISDAISELPLESRVSGILRAITVADRSGIDAELWQLCQQYGVNHLLVISGLHIGLLAGAGALLGRLAAAGLLLLGRYRVASAMPTLLALLFASAYTALAGFSLATSRALIMLLCLLLARLVARGSSAWNNLAIAAFLVLLVNPLAALGSGFWLSFIAVAILLWVANWQADRGKLRRGIGVHLFMSLAMVPLTGWWFGGASQVSALANSLLVPLAGFWVIPLALAAALALLTGLPVSGALWQLAGWPLEQLLPLASRAVADYSHWLYRPLAPGPVAVVLALLALALLIVPGRWQLKALLPLLALPVVLPPTHADTLTADAVHVVVLDVGQGTAVVVYSRTRALLYDTGGGVPGAADIATTVVLPFLRARGIGHLDTVVVSHSDADHSAGLQSIRAGISLNRQLLGSDLAAGPDQRCRAGAAWRWPGGTRFQVLAPADESGLSTNNGSCVLQIHVGGYRLLLPGDIDASREQELVRYWGGALASDWLLAAHHGSHSSSSYALLKTVDPATVVFSSGYRNPFGHPHPAVAQRYAEFGVASYDTASSGAVEFVFRDSQAPLVRTWRGARQKFWEH